MAQNACGPLGTAAAVGSLVPSAEAPSDAPEEQEHEDAPDVQAPASPALDAAGIDTDGGEAPARLPSRASSQAAALPPVAMDVTPAAEPPVQQPSPHEEMTALLATIQAAQPTAELTAALVHTFRAAQPTPELLEALAYVCKSRVR